MTKHQYKKMINDDILGYGISQFHTKKGFWSIEIDPFGHNYNNPHAPTKYSVLLFKDHISKEVLDTFRDKTLDEAAEIVSGEY